jgi:hypothetical protein
MKNQKRMQMSKRLNMKPTKVRIVKLIIFKTIFAAALLISSCAKQKEERISVDQYLSGKWDSAFLDASRVFQIGEIKKVVFENPYAAEQCLIVSGGSSVEEMDVVRKSYVDYGIPALVAEKLMGENMGEGVRVFFLKDDVVLNSIHLMSIRSCNSIYYKEIGKQVTFSIQLVPQLTEWAKDPTFFKQPEIGQDYFTNPDHPKPVEIIKVE